MKLNFIYPWCFRKIYNVLSKYQIKWAHNSNNDSQHVFTELRSRIETTVYRQPTLLWNCHYVTLYITLFFRLVICCCYIQSEENFCLVVFAYLPAMPHLARSSEISWISSLSPFYETSIIMRCINISVRFNSFLFDIDDYWLGYTMRFYLSASACSWNSNATVTSSWLTMSWQKTSIWQTTKLIWHLHISTYFWKDENMISTKF